MNPVTIQDLVDSAKNFPIASKNFRNYISLVENEIWTSRIKNIVCNSMGYSKQGSPILVPDKKNRPKLIGEIFRYNAPVKDNEYGYIIENLIHFKIQFTVFQIKRQLYLSSYSYHFELLNDKSKYFRYEKTEYTTSNEKNYKPMLHMHVMGRLPHYPAPLVTIGQLLNIIKTNMFNPDNIGRLDPPWGKLFLNGS